MPDVLNSQVTDTINTTNAKTVGEGTAFATNLAHQNFAQAAGLAAQNAVTVQQRMNDVGVQASQAFTNNMHNLDMVQAASMATLKGSELPGIMAQLGSVVAALQQIVKTAQTTPPQTGGA